MLLVNTVNEIVIALIRPTGIVMENVRGCFEEAASHVGAKIEIIKMTSSIFEEKFAENVGKAEKPETGSPKYLEIRKGMRKGNSLCQKFERADFFGLYAAKKINENRRKRHPTEGFTNYKDKIIYVIDSVKRKQEAEVLRKIYGDSLFFVGINSPLEKRFLNLTKIKRMNDNEAQELILVDNDENASGIIGSDGVEEKFQQNSSSVFQLADFFMQDVGDRDPLTRFVAMLFSNPHESPTAEEFFMNIAFSASLRSRDLSRQVGAAIVSKEGDLLSIGRNDVPRFGSLNEGSDNSDFAKGVDSNKEIIQSIVESIKEIVANQLPMTSKEDLEKVGKAIEKTTKVGDLTEFGRAVHAEMTAISDCAKLGVSLRGSTLYTTTFPCHNCCKHIISAGISKVVYIEPYSKSSAILLHSDSVVIDDQRSIPSNKVVFVPFTGVAPRRFVDLFSTKPKLGFELKRKLSDGKRTVWRSAESAPRYPMLIDIAYAAELRIVTYFEEISRDGNELQAASGDK